MKFILSHVTTDSVGTRYIIFKIQYSNGAAVYTDHLR